MYDYIALRINANPCDENITDLIAAYLAEDEFETFEADTEGLTAYIRKDKYNPDKVLQLLEDFPIPTKFEISEKEIKGEDWNKEWEQNYFQPIRIGDSLVIRSSFHQDFPEVPLQIIIDPKMAFGTGHHATTAGMSRMLLEENLTDKTVIDMGTGTGILSIIAKKLGASNTVGIEIDEFAIENAIENGKLNEVDIKWLAGDDQMLNSIEPADIFLANINLNVITGNLDKYAMKMKKGGKIFLSGFLKTDRDKILSEAGKYNLQFLKESGENNWMTMVFELPLK